MSGMNTMAAASLAEPDEIAELSVLYDFYGNLLKDNHREIFEDYVWNNLSLGEIAAERQITRQGVYDVVKRCRNRLREYEEKLQLVQKYRQIKERLQEIERVAGQAADAPAAESIRKLTEEIYDMI